MFIVNKLGTQNAYIKFSIIGTELLLVAYNPVCCIRQWHQFSKKAECDLRNLTYLGVHRVKYTADREFK